MSILFAIGLMAAVSDVAAPAVGDASLLNVVLVILIVTTILTVGAVVFAVLAWKEGYWALAGRIHYTLVTLAAVVFVWLCGYWNLLGWRF